MPNNFGLVRNLDLSTAYYLETQLEASWTNISVVKGFPQINAPTQLPIVSVRLITNTVNFNEIGSRELDEVYTFVIDVFAKSDGQRLDLAQFIQDKLLLDWTYYTHSHSSGNPEVLSRVSAGIVKFIRFTDNSKLDFIEDVELYDKYRHFFSFDCRIALT